MTQDKALTVLQARPISKPWIETPLVESAVLSRQAGCRVFLKLENIQPSGSFKIRGLGHLVLQTVHEQATSTDDRPLHFFASSGGNAGLAAVTASTTLGYKCTVVVPSSTEPSMVTKIKTAGARNVIVHGDSWTNADSYMRETVMAKAERDGERAIYLPPFDHPDIWAGNATMMSEIDRQMPDGQQPDAVVCSIGGGGLFCGVMEGIHTLGWSNTQILAVETRGADSLAQSVAVKKLITLSGISSVAKSLGAVRVAQKAFDYATTQSNGNVVHPVVIEDAEACASSWRFADDERVLTEPACGASVAMAYDGRLKQVLPGLKKDSKVVIVVCGGSRIDLGLLETFKQQFGTRARELGLSRC